MRKGQIVTLTYDNSLQGLPVPADVEIIEPQSPGYIWLDVALGVRIPDGALVEVFECTRCEEGRYQYSCTMDPDRCR